MVESQGGKPVSNFHLQEIQSLQNSLREREEYVIELENRLRALWDKYDGDRKHYIGRINRLEEFASRFLNPDDLGWAIGKYDRDEAREALGKERVESKAKEDKL